MIRDYDPITQEQEASETVIFGHWFDWFMNQHGIPLDMELQLENGEVRTIKDFKDMHAKHFPLQESTLTYLPGVAVATDRTMLLEYVRRVMNGFYKMGFLE